MPTRNRPEFALAAVRLFEEQSWSNKELVIVDDRISPSFREFTPGLARYHSAGSMPIGAKRNICCAHARGEIIITWDDDDWYANDRIERQVELLMASGADVAGYRAMLFHDYRNGRMWHCTGIPDYGIGVSLIYRKQYWRLHPFAETMARCEEYGFQAWARGEGKLLLLPDAGQLIIASIHDGNMTPRELTKAGWRAVPRRVEA